jgi:hypothetical protein
MRPPFRYLADPAFLVCVAIYFTNRQLESYGWGFWITTYYLNDFICLAFWMPIMVGILRLLRLREHDDPPTRHESVIGFAVWATMFELWLPSTQMFAGLTVSDPWDIVCYGLGGVLITAWWEWFYQNDGTSMAA